MTDMDRNEWQKNMDPFMLKALVMQFLVETKMPLETVGHTKFIALMNFVKPGIVLPTVQELTKAVARCFPKYKNGEETNIVKPTYQSSGRTVKKRRAIAIGDSNGKRIPISAGSASKLTPMQDLIGSDNNQVGEEKTLNMISKTGSSDITAGSDKWIDSALNENKPKCASTFHEHPQDDHSRRQSCSSFPDNNTNNITETMTCVKSEAGTPYEDSMNVDMLRASSSDNSISPPYPKTCDETDKQIDPKSLKLSDFDEKPNIGRDQQTNTPRNLDTIGYSYEPCIVCCRPQSIVNLRRICSTHADIMILICVQNKTYSMEIAKQCAAIKNPRCCSDHLDDMYHGALNNLGIVSPEIDIHQGNQRIRDGYQIIKEIKSSLPVAPLKVYLKVLKNFLEIYRRKSFERKSRPVHRPSDLHNNT